MPERQSAQTSEVKNVG